MKRSQKRVMAVGVILALVLSTAMVLLPRRASAETTTIEPPLMDTTVDQSNPDADLGREQRLNVDSTSSYMIADGETIILGREVSGSIDDTHRSDDVYVRYQEAQDSSTTYLEPDYQTITTGLQTGGVFPDSVIHSDNQYATYAEVNTGTLTTSTKLPTANQGTPTDNCGSPSDTGDWTNPNNAHSDTDAGASATAAPAKNINYCTKWKTFGFNLPAVTVSKVQVKF